MDEKMMSRFVLETEEQIVFDFKCECSECEADGKLGLYKKDGMKPFDCPESCGAVYVPWQFNGRWQLKAVVMPVFKVSRRKHEHRRNSQTLL